MSLDIVTQEELVQLTGYKLASKQFEVLRKLGVIAIKRPDNTLSVLREWIVNINSGVKPKPPHPQLRKIK